MIDCLGGFDQFDDESSIIIDFDNETKVDVKKAKEFIDFFSSNNNNFDRESGFIDCIVSYNKKTGKLKNIETQYDKGNFSGSYIFAQKISEMLISGKVKILFVSRYCEEWKYIIKPNNVTTYLGHVVMYLREFNTYLIFRKIDALAKSINGLELLEKAIENIEIPEDNSVED